MTRRLLADPYLYPCTSCGAQPWQECTTKTGRNTELHSPRIQAAHARATAKRVWVR